MTRPTILAFVVAVCSGISADYIARQLVLIAHAQEPSIAAIQVPRELVESALNAQQELNTWAAIARYTSGQIEGYCTKRGMAVRRDGLWCDPVVKEQSK